MAYSVLQGELIRTDQELTLDHNIWLAPNVIVRGPVVIGAGCKIYPGTVIGYGPEAYGDRDTDHPIHIGAGTVLREGVVIQRGLYGPTCVGDGCYVMHGAHIAHDSILFNCVTMSPYSVAAGHVRLCEGVNMGISSITHQHVVIGAWSMVGMGAVVIGHVPPTSKVVGNPARIIGVNLVGLDRMGIWGALIDHAHEDYELLVQQSQLSRLVK